MGIKVHLKNLKHHNYDVFLVVLDLVMVGLVLLSIFLLIMQWFWGFQLVHGFFEITFPDFYTFYDQNINYYFILIDGVFVTIFIMELLFRWTLAIIKKTYRKWYYYPFIHWYDVLGCIPDGFLRLLRILRVFFVITRLERMGVLDLSQSDLYNRIKFYRNLITEEVSDKVVIRVLDGLQDQFGSGAPVLSRIMVEVVEPHKTQLAGWAAHRIQDVTFRVYDEHKGDLRVYLTNLVKESVEQNAEVKNLSRIPVVGNKITEELEHAISDIVFRVLDGLAHDLASSGNQEVIRKLAETSVDALMASRGDEDLNAITMEILTKALEVVKQQVAIQEWKVELEKEGQIHLVRNQELSGNTAASD